jgi:wyosine [tRNA(Phe)-imidazoG37] synthetase (radical SAM superfamily)
MQISRPRIRVLKLQEGIIYGPIKSRRLGISLGINLMPTTYKLCPLNCIYCQYGWTNSHSDDASAYMDDLPTTDKLERALESWLRRGENINYITFSGNGEPCLHPQFDQMVEVASRLRDKYAPQARLAVLSNSSCLNKKTVTKALNQLDKRIMKLDCGSEETFQKINRPHRNIKYERIVGNLKNLNGIIIQSLFVDGEINNIETEEIEKWMERLDYIKPQEVQIYSIDRPSADKNLKLVGKEKLKEIAQKAEKTIRILVMAF